VPFILITVVQRAVHTLQLNLHDQGCNWESFKNKINIW